MKFRTFGDVICEGSLLLFVAAATVEEDEVQRGQQADRDLFSRDDKSMGSEAHFDRPLPPSTELLPSSIELRHVKEDGHGQYSKGRRWL